MGRAQAASQPRTAPRYPLRAARREAPRVSRRRRSSRICSASCRQPVKHSVPPLEREGRPLNRGIFGLEVVAKFFVSPDRLPRCRLTSVLLPEDAARHHRERFVVLERKIYDIFSRLVGVHAHHHAVHVQMQRDYMCIIQKEALGTDL